MTFYNQEPLQADKELLNIVKQVSGYTWKSMTITPQIMSVQTAIRLCANQLVSLSDEGVWTVSKKGEEFINS